MVNGKMPLIVTLLAAAVLGAAVLVLQPYSADFPGTAFAKPARRYIQAALAQDSLALTRLSASPTPVRWALHAARTRPESLAAWAGHVEAWTGERMGDTTQVLVFASGERCSHVPIVLRFVGSAGHVKVAEAGSACLDSTR
jgi:hypothetical protein